MKKDSICQAFAYAGAVLYGGAAAVAGWHGVHDVMNNPNDGATGLVFVLTSVTGFWLGSLFGFAHADEHGDGTTLSYIGETAAGAMIGATGVVGVAATAAGTVGAGLGYIIGRPVQAACAILRHKHLSF